MSMVSPLLLPLCNFWQCDSREAARICWAEVIRDDAYRFREIALQSPCDWLVNLGGNVGTTDVAFHTYFSSSRSITLEPCEATFKKLRANVMAAGMTPSSAICVQAGFGTGRPVRLVAHEGTGACRFAEVSGDAEASPTDVPTMTLRSIYDKVGIVPTDVVYLKVDCEGAEVALMHPDNLPLFSSAAYVGIEFHMSHLGVPIVSKEVVAQIYGTLLMSHRALYTAWKEDIGISVAIRNDLVKA